jgi:hypothetical protein
MSYSPFYSSAGGRKQRTAESQAKDACALAANTSDVMAFLGFSCLYSEFDLLSSLLCASTRAGDSTRCVSHYSLRCSCTVRARCVISVV